MFDQHTHSSVPILAHSTDALGRVRAPRLPRPKVSHFLSALPFLVMIICGVGFIATGIELDHNLSEVNWFLRKVSDPPGETQHSSKGGEQFQIGKVPGEDFVFSAQRTLHARAEGVASDGRLEAPISPLAPQFLKEIGVAFLVAGLVGIIIERRAREHDSQRHHELQMRVAENAMFALFGLSHERAFVQAVLETNLKAEVVRTHLDQTYKLRFLTDEEARLVNPAAPADAKNRFLMLDMVQHYQFKNVSASPIIHNIPLAVARRRGHGAMALTRVTFLSLGHKPVSEDEIRKAIDQENSREDYLRYIWRRRIEPGESLSVVANVACLKERSDNEVWGSFFPTMGEVNLSLEVPEAMNFGLRPISNADMREKDEVPSPTRRSWILSGPLLRHNSAVFWWRTYADDGAGV